MSEPYELSDVFVNAINSKEDAPAPQVGMDDSGINLIKKFEGFNTKAYGDYGQYSIGYGTRAKSPDEVITQEEADTRLRDETSLVSKYIQNTIKVPLTQNQHNALVSFGYNIGVGGIGALAEDINAGNHQRVAERMLTFNRAGGQVLPGLVKRRQLESQMYGSDAQVSVAAPEVIDVESNSLVELSTGSGARFSVHSSHGEKFKGFLSELESLGYHVDPSQSGGYNYRKIAGSNRWSTHAFGASIDINWHRNTRQKGVTDLPDNVGEIAKKYGLSWGGTWSNPDYMHFEVSGSNKGTPTHLGVTNRVKTDGTIPDTPQYNAYPGLPYQRMAEVPKDVDGSIKKTPGVLDATVEFLGSFQNTIKAVGSATKPSQRSDYKLGDYTA